MGWEDVYKVQIRAAILKGTIPKDFRHLIGAPKHTPNHKTQRTATICLRAAMLKQWAACHDVLVPWVEGNERELLDSEPGLNSHVPQHMEGIAGILRACQIAKDDRMYSRVLRFVVDLLWFASACDPWLTGEIVSPGVRCVAPPSFDKNFTKQWLSNSRQGAAMRTFYRIMIQRERRGLVDKPGGVDVGQMLASVIGNDIPAHANGFISASDGPKLRGGPLVVATHLLGHVAAMPNLTELRSATYVWAERDPVTNKVIRAGYSHDGQPDLSAVLGVLESPK